MSYILPFWAEMRKQIIRNSQTLESIISIVIWPLLSFLEIYYMYKSFDITGLRKYGIATENDLLVFLVTGSVGSNAYWAMVSGALEFNDERRSGTLEIIFMSPANRLSFVYGRAFGGIFQAIWLFIVYSTLLLLLNNESINQSLWQITISMIITLFSSVIWGGFVNSLFVSSRDNGYLFSIMDAPMELFSGSRIPIETYPIVWKLISTVFPLTYTLYTIRSVMKIGPSSIVVLCVGVLVHLLLMVATSVILRVSELHSFKNGTAFKY